VIKIAYIGKTNQTNSFICDTIQSNYSAVITFHKPDDLFDKPEMLDDSSLDLAIFDLNSSYGIGNAPKSIQKINQYLITSPLLVMYPSSFNYITPLIEAGANGVIPNTPTESEITEAIDNLLSGSNYFSEPE
jgi:DNA-binding NarL/FixJ family response regulator